MRVDHLDTQALLLTKQQQLAELLGAHFDRHVVDHTGLTAAYTFSLPVAQGDDNDPKADSPTEQDLSTAECLAELGLRLKTAKEPVERLSMDDIERPPEN
ncbi:MAG TPA: TIGR03435 family protein [Edaphobacter sp.]|uniref:TIGR03435 family protein n=1 Tax=Edaphobacter sp. TaxID=1934404 RepID=UPI002C7083A5|nr:TIGR03435 family protein [Edaphobacter sp.]HUZ93439.1 TIGR03435 family protein [Edaphobacter sp.]